MFIIYKTMLEFTLGFCVGVYVGTICDCSVVVDAAGVVLKNILKKVKNANKN